MVRDRLRRADARRARLDGRQGGQAARLTPRSADAAGAVTGDNTFDASSQRNVGIGATYAFSKALI
ncbi:porin, partial [Burkholderia pseudomallei]|nr:porin [Burkholderia pseudomallei]MBF3913199.1 porin [Burkholderia pseudomallei]